MKNNVHTQYSSIARSPIVSAISRFVSPLFLVMLVASFIFWFVTKLNYNYTTELDIKMRIEDQKFYATCVVEGGGANLFGYYMYRGGTMRLRLDELKHRIVKSNDGEQFIHIDKSSLSNIISVRYSDIKLISIESLPEVPLTERIKESMPE